LEAEIILAYDSPLEAEAIAEAVSPDNVKVPLGLSIKTVRRKAKVLTRIECEESRFGTFISTIDDFLSCVSVAEKALSAVKRLA
jgi:tRNA threonylcarbamoyladenosine modification (KEOPS) complex  Pcc1 subunit